MGFLEQGGCKDRHGDLMRSREFGMAASMSHSCADERGYHVHPMPVHRLPIRQQTQRRVCCTF